MSVQPPRSNHAPPVHPKILLILGRTKAYSLRPNPASVGARRTTGPYKGPSFL